eukprot:CAMPEP_0185747434 /NCGR_PEP_ID=MMETSP1174-20130828/6051_1 /TAXON_ID=35687 /ORGANISM="Dictyocha speculum, Strain CCMP1381" /LENGTH=99 /DNA_ID=CAMNT_0028422599 /DNA_START=727 /DNA_END=1026 /DNA_ORIENTATION=-
MEFAVFVGAAPALDESVALLGHQQPDVDDQLAERLKGVLQLWDLLSGPNVRVDEGWVLLYQGLVINRAIILWVGIVRSLRQIRFPLQLLTSMAPPERVE